MMQHIVQGGGNLNLYVEEHGDPQGPPLLFIHGYSQCRLAWVRQTESDLATTFRLLCLDIRGHGLSDKPESSEAYSDSALWADDIAAVLTNLNLQKPVLVGSSYAGYIICDYIRHYGQTQIGAINFVSAATKMGGKAAVAYLGKDFVAQIPGTFSRDAQESVTALQNFIRLLTFHEQTPEEFYQMLGYNVVVPPHVRQALFSRRLDNDDILAQITVPVLLTHGDADAVVLPSASKHYAGLIPHAQTSFYPDTGHSPFAEAPERFNRELAVFAPKAL